MGNKVVLLATLETKREETQYLREQLLAYGLVVDVIDLSLGSGGVEWDSATKMTRMGELCEQAGKPLKPLLASGDVRVVAGIGGGTGGEIVLQALRGLPIALPKFLISTLPFDPRIALADSSVVIVPTLADIEGLNASLRQVFHQAAAMINGLCQAPVLQASSRRAPSVGVTALGATGGACKAMVKELRARGYEATVFHANGYGGAAFARFTVEKAFDAVIDMTVHEITRIKLAGAHVDMPNRFSCAHHLPRLVLPGGLNFLGLGEFKLLPTELLRRPHYRHSGLFTHVKLTEAQMQQVADALATELNAATAPVHLLLPMGGFSHEDRPGGAIEDVALRMLAAEVLQRSAVHYQVTRVPHHINAAETAITAVEILVSLITHKGTTDHV